MNNTTVAKIAGWGQFMAQLLGGIATTGLPTGAIGWLQLVTSLGAAIGIHASANTDGSK